MWKRTRNKPLRLMEKLIKQYEAICEKLVAEYCKKNDVEAEFWVADDIGGSVAISDSTIISIEEIIFDLKHNIPKNTYNHYQEYIMEWYNKDKDKDLVNDFKINYKSYCKGVRYDSIKESVIKTSHL